MRRTPFIEAMLAGVFSLAGGAAALSPSAAAPEGRPSERASRWPSPKEKGAYQVRLVSTGKILWEVAWETTVTGPPARRRVEILERGRGQPLRYREPVTWEKRMVFHAPSDPAAGGVQFESVEGSRWDREGKRIGRMEIRADPLRRRVTYSESEPGTPPQSSRFPWEPRLLPDELLFHWARTLPFESPPGEFLLVVSPARRFRMQARAAGTERVTTPAGTFPCYRVALAPKLFGPLKALAPKMFLWCAEDPPHFWVRYQGPVGGPGSPEAVIELVRFEGSGS